MNNDSSHVTPAETDAWLRSWRTSTFKFLLPATPPASLPHRNPRLCTIYRAYYTQPHLLSVSGHPSRPHSIYRENVARDLHSLTLHPHLLPVLPSFAAMAAADCMSMASRHHPHHPYNQQYTRDHRSSYSGFGSNNPYASYISPASSIYEPSRRSISDSVFTVPIEYLWEPAPSTNRQIPDE